jgi:Spy/CpxP family protein refolding chaperone
MIFYMHPDTARALLQRSRQITATLRARRSLVAQLKRIGWDEAAARELADIDARMKESKQ